MPSRNARPWARGLSHLAGRFSSRSFLGWRFATHSPPWSDGEALRAGRKRPPRGSLPKLPPGWGEGPKTATQPSPPPWQMVRLRGSRKQDSFFPIHVLPPQAKRLVGASQAGKSAQCDHQPPPDVGGLLHYPQRVGYRNVGPPLHGETLPMLNMLERVAPQVTPLHRLCGKELGVPKPPADRAISQLPADKTLSELLRLVGIQPIQGAAGPEKADQVAGNLFPTNNRRWLVIRSPDPDPALQKLA